MQKKKKLVSSMAFFALIITWLPATLAFIAILALLVLIHEWGHYMAARRAGMTVQEFGFGFPPRVFGWKKGDTLYSFNLIPLGGFVKILGEDSASREPGSFTSKSVGARIFVVVAGVLMNFVLAYCAIAVSFWLSYPPLVSNPEAYGVTKGLTAGRINEIQVGSLAERSGLRVDDLLLKIGTVDRPDTAQVRQQIMSHQGQDLPAVIQRDDANQTISLAVGEEELLGVVLVQQIPEVHYVWWQVPYFALIETGRVIWATFVALMAFFARLFTTAQVPAEVMGPVGIFTVTAAAVKLGFAYVLSLITILSVNLGIINILPFPALDGGRFVFLLAEKIRGRRVAERIEGTIHQIGFIFLIILIVLVTYRDIIRL